MIIKCFSTLDKDEDEKLPNQQKVNYIINGIRVQDVQLMAATSYIAGQYRRDVTMACAYFGSTVQPKLLAKQVAASAVKYTQQTVVVATEVVLPIT